MFAVDDPSATYKLLWKEFEARGYTCEEIYINDEHYVRYTSPNGKAWLTRAERITYPLNNPIISTISTQKSLAYAFAERAGVSIPKTIIVDENNPLDEKVIHDLLKKHGTVIVKPENASLSRGLSINLHSYDEVLKAVQVAMQFSPSVLVQQQVEGEEIRFVVLNGDIKAAMLRQTARVIGDGISTVSQLIEIENEARKTLTFTHISYPQLNEAIITKPYDKSYVAAKDEIISLASSTMIKGGASIYNIIDDVDDSYKLAVSKLANYIGAGFVVVDMFIKDYTQMQTKTNAYFIEFNTAPVLKLFYGARDNKMFNAVPLLVDAIHNRLHEA